MRVREPVRPLAAKGRCRRDCRLEDDMADYVVEPAAWTRPTSSMEALNMTDTTMRWVPMAEAAAAMGTSIRTLQRRAKAGEIRTMATGRKVLVALDDTTTDGGRAGEVARIVKHLETTEKMAMAAIAMSERSTLDLGRQLTAAKRETTTARLAAFAAGLVAAAGVAAAVAMVQHRSYLADRLAAAERAVAEAEVLAASEAECRREAEAERDRLASAMVDEVLAATGR